jgi:hypothetical protein
MSMMSGSSGTCRVHVKQQGNNTAHDVTQQRHLQGGATIDLAIEMKNMSSRRIHSSS